MTKQIDTTGFRTLQTANPELNNGRREVIFIEDSLADYQTLIDGLKAGVAVVLLDSFKDGLSAMADWARTHEGYNAIHVFSHGTAGSLALGRFTLDNASLETRQVTLAQLGQALTVDGDILLYGCNVAAGDIGAQFVGRLAQLTGADVAASDDLTGAGRLGGDWVLEQASGPLQTQTLTSSAWMGVLIPLSNEPLSISSLNGDSVLWAGVGNSVALDNLPNLTVTDPENDAANWDGASLTVQRIVGSILTPSASDLFYFAPTDFTVSGADLKTGSTTFATFTNAGGVLTINFNSSATSALVQDVMRGVLYRNDTPAGDASIRFALSDGTSTATADVTVSSDSIYVTNTTDTATIDVSDGVSFSEAVAIAASDSTGSQTLVLGSNLTEQSIAVSGNPTLLENLKVDGDGANGAHFVSGTITVGEGVKLTFSNGSGDRLGLYSNGAVLAGAGGLIKEGAGALHLYETNTHSGGTLVSGGSLDMPDHQGLGSGTVTLDGGTLNFFSDPTIANAMVIGAGGGSVDGGPPATISGNISGPGTLTLTGGSQYSPKTLSGTNTHAATVVASGGLNLSGGAAIADTASITLVSGATLALSTSETIGSLAGAGALALGANTLTTGGDNTSTTFDGVISGTGSLLKQGSGTLTLSGDNTYSGLTTLQGGTLSVASDSNLGGGELSLSDSATLQVTGATHVDNGINLFGAAVLQIDAAVTLSGLISGGGTGLTKTGSGTLTLFGTNTYAGTTTVSAGSLLVNGTNSGTGSVSVLGTGILGGSGSIAGSVSLASGATLSAGSITAAEDLATGALSLLAGSVLSVQIGGASAGTAYDQINVTGSVDLTGATLDLSLINSFVPNSSHSFTLIYNDESDAIIGTFAGLAEGATLTVGSTNFKISYVGGTNNNDVVLTCANSAPTITSVPSDVTVTEDTASPIELSALTLADADDNTLTLTLTASAGTLAASSGGDVTVGGSGTTALTLSGSAANLNTYFDTVTNLQYTSALNANGDNAATLTISASDGTTGFVANPVVNLDIVAVNDAPVLFPLAVAGEFTYGMEGRIEGAVGLAGAYITSDITDLSSLGGISGSTIRSALRSLVSDNQLVLTQGSARITFDTPQNSAQLSFVNPLQAPSGLGSVVTTAIKDYVSPYRTITFFGANDEVLAIIPTTVSHVANSEYINQLRYGSSTLTREQWADLYQVSYTAVGGQNIHAVSISKSLNSSYSKFAIDTLGLDRREVTAALTPIVEGMLTNGDTIESLIADGRITDADLSTAAPKAIAVSAVDNTHGIWQYQVDAGEWTAFDFITNANKALLLSSTDSVRFVPTANYSGTVPSGITFHAWDQSSGQAGEYLIVTGNSGGSGALSLATSSASITVTPNTAPTITGVTSSTTIDDSATTTPFSAVTLADVDANNVSVSITLDAAAKGVFTAASLTASGFVDAGNGVYTLASGSGAAATTAIRQLVFDPTDNRVLLNSTETTTFTIAVNDGVSTTSDATTTVVSTSVNDAPLITGVPGSALAVTTGQAAALADFTVSDPDGADVVLAVTLTASNGSIGSVTDADTDTPGIQLTGTAAQINTALAATTFTASVAGAASVGISISDGLAAPVTATYGLSASNPPVAPSDPSTNLTPEPTPTPAPTQAPRTEDGATVTTGTTTTTNGLVLDVMTVTPVSDNRLESTGDANRADIALYYSDSAKDVPATTASLPTGVGLTATGARTPANNTEALSNLITLVNQTAGNTESNRQDMVSGGQSFLDRLDQQADKGPLIVNSIKLTVAPGQTTAPDKPITITGSTDRVTQGNGNGNGGAPVEAIVIDTRALPPGTVLELKDIEFAVIIGDNVTIRGGEGANIVFAGSGPQNIVLGEDDDELSGGDGDDIIGSTGGNDLINGDAGNDWLVGGVGNDTVNGGEGNDLLHGGASDAGTYRFTLNDAGKARLDWSATHADMAPAANLLIDGQWWNANGQLALSDARFAFVGADGAYLQDITALYQAVIKQLPSVADLNAWVASGMSSSALAQLAYEVHLSQQGPGAQALEVQMTQLIESVWGGTADPALIQAGASHINQGGSWGEALLYLARHSNNTQAITDAQGRLKLAQDWTLKETGWSGEGGNDLLNGGAGNDVLVAGSGNNVLDGGSGTDLAVFFGHVNDWQIAVNDVQQIVVSNCHSGVQNVIRDIELLQFGDTVFGQVKPDHPVVVTGVQYAITDFFAPATTAQVAMIGVAEWAVM